MRQAEDEEDADDANWQSATHPDDARLAPDAHGVRKFWYHRHTQETRWDLPPAVARRHAKQAKLAALAGGGT